MLADAGADLRTICDKSDCWGSLLDSLSRVVDAYATRGGVEMALRFVKSIAHPLDNTNAQSKEEKAQAQSRLASFVIDRAFKFDSHTKDSLKGMFLLVESYEPKHFDRCIVKILEQDARIVSAPLALEMKESGEVKSAEGQGILGRIALESQHAIQLRISNPLGLTKDWSRKEVVSFHNESAVGCEKSINHFLRSPCKRSDLVPVGRKHHLLLKEQLAPLISWGRLSMRFCRPDGERLWHVKLDKAFQPPMVTFSFFPQCLCPPFGVN